MPPEIGIGEPLNLALARTGQMLFTPFRAKKWLAFGLLAGMMLAGFGMPPALTIAIELGVRYLIELSFDDVLNWVNAHLMAILLVMCGSIIVVFFPIYVLCRWMNGRATMVFYDNLVKGEFELKATWKEFREIGNSLMKLLITWELIVFNAWLLALIVMGVLMIPDFKSMLETGTYEPSGWSYGALVFFVVAAMVISLATIFASCVIFMLAVPVMYVRRIKAKAAIRVAWREIFLPHKKVCLLYFICNIIAGAITGSVMGIGLLLLGIVTLCMACVVYVLPIVGNYPAGIAALPIITFQGLFRLSFVSQFGENYRIPWTPVASSGRFPVTITPSAP